MNIPAPIIQISASQNPINYNGTTTITWSASYARSCTNAWWVLPSSWTYTTLALTGNITYSLACTGSGGTSTGTITINVWAAPLQSISIIWPNSGTLGTASSIFTLSATRPILDNATIMLSSGSWWGVFTPSTVMLTPSTSTATFTYTPSSSGIKIITVNNDRWYTNPTPLNFVVSPLGKTITTFTLTAGITDPAAPFTVWHAFRKWDVPAGTEVSILWATAQITPKNYYNDGSLKFAIIAGTINASSTWANTVTLVTGIASTGSILTLTKLHETQFQTQISTNLFWGASWSGTDWDRPFMTWVTGSEMSSWIYRKQIGNTYTSYDG